MKTVKTNAPKGEVCPPDRPVPVDVWRRCTDQAGVENGYTVRDRWRTIGEVIDDLKGYLQDRLKDDYSRLEYFAIGSGNLRGMTWPGRTGQLAPCYFHGSNEGMFAQLLHLDAGKYSVIFTAKTLAEGDEGPRIARLICKCFADALML